MRPIGRYMLCVGQLIALWPITGLYAFLLWHPKISSTFL